MNIRPASWIPHRSSRAGLAAVALAIGLGLGGCGHEDSAAPKTTASYQGKPDTPPWAHSRWHDSKADWERAITAREQGQNEYVRITR